MIRRSVLRVAGLLVLLGLACASLAPERGPLRLVVLHTNDLHGQMLPRERRAPDGTVRKAGGFAALGAAIRRARDEARARDEEVLLVDAGDWFEGTPEARRSRGTAVVEWMNLVAFDAAALGNHEFDYGLDHLRSLVRLARFPVVAANATDAASRAPIEGVAPHAVFERGGVRVAFVGLVSHDTPELTRLGMTDGIRFEDERDAVGGAVASARARADLVLLLTHCGLDADRALAALVPEVPLVVGGHSHTRLAEPVKVGSTLVVQTGGRAESIGRVELAVDRRTKRVESASARLVDLFVDETGEEPASAALVEREAAPVRAAMAAAVGVLRAPIERGRGIGSSPAGNLVCDATREAAGADIAFANEGGLRTNLPAGEATLRSFFELVPFDNTIVVVEMRGAEVEDLLRAAVRGEGVTPLETSGLVVRWRRGPDGKGELVEAACGGKPLEAGRTYRIAVNSFLAGGGDRYPQFRAARNARDTGTLVRDAVVEWVRARSPLAPPVEERFPNAP